MTGPAWSRKARILLFLGALALPGLLHVLGAGRGTEAEQRAPAPLPTRPADVAGWRALPAAMDAYLNDHFGLRGPLVTLHAWMQRKLGAIGNEEVVAGKEGWLFLSRLNGTLDQHRGLDRFTPEALETWVAEMERRARLVRTSGAVFLLAVAPNANTIHPEFLPDWVTPSPVGTRLDQVQARLARTDIPWVDLRAALLAGKPAMPGALYHRTDSHWNGHGTWLAFQALAGAVARLRPDAEGFDPGAWRFHTETADGDLAKLAGLAGVLKEEVIRAGPAGTSRFVAADDLGNRTVALRSVVPKGPRVLLMRDSFGVGLHPFFAETYPLTVSAHHGWGGFDERLIAEHRPDVVIYELVERILNEPLRPGP